ncbi:MAG: DUF302 domain-containing protein [Caldimonas sp.]
MIARSIAAKEPLMNRCLSLAFAALVSVTPTAFAADGLVAVKSPYAVRETLDRLEVNVKQRGLKVFARVDHAAGAASVGKSLRPNEVLIFGGPQGGTPFMECASSVGIDLPLKALAWQDEQGQVWLAYNDPAFVAQRHGAAQCPAVAPLGKALSALVAETIAR